MSKTFTYLCLFPGFMLLASFGARAADPILIDHTTQSVVNVRDARYCEIIPVVRDDFHFVATVYNTLGLNDCPAAIWDTITEADMKRHFGAVKVLLNGPRHFLMDTITGTGATAAGKKIEVSGLAMAERASLDLNLFDLFQRPYEEKKVDRETQYIFKAGLPVFVLNTPDDSHYIMQAYSQIVDKQLTYSALPGLGARLKLPSGWRFSTTTPEQDMVLGSHGQAIVLQDEFQNTYQKVE